MSRLSESVLAVLDEVWPPEVFNPEACITISACPDEDAWAMTCSACSGETRSAYLADAEKLALHHGRTEHESFALRWQP